MHFKYKLLLTLSLILLLSCIKDEFVDFEEGTIVSIELKPEILALLINESYENLELKFKGFSTEDMNKAQTWGSSNNQVVTVDNNGKITANGIGQAFIWVNVNNISSDSLMVNVVGDEMSVARVEIENTEISIEKDSSLQFTAKVYNINNDLITNEQISWTSTDETKASISTNGLLTGITTGSTEIIATAGGINSLAKTIEVTSQDQNGLQRMGDFSASGNYTVTGSAILKQVDASTLELILSDDFSTSNGPGLYIYLATTNTGTISNGGNGYRVSGQLSGSSLSGGRTYTIPSSDVMLNTYDYVIIYCEPFGIPFGNAFLN